MFRIAYVSSLVLGILLRLQKDQERNPELPGQSREASWLQAYQDHLQSLSHRDCRQSVRWRELQNKKLPEQGLDIRIRSSSLEGPRD